MRPWKLLGSATVPGEGAALRLMQRDEEFVIMAGTNVLMGNRQYGSEEDLATLTLERIAGHPAPHVLIGGLGMGFTLRAALAAMPQASRITVAELVPQIIEWARGPLQPVFAGSLEDPRVDIALADVGRTIGAATSRYDAILLDVDNGPEGLSRESNDRLYTRAGLVKSLKALKPGGVLAVWSAHPSPLFSKRLTDAGFHTEEKQVRARHGGRGARHTIWLGTRP
jgi:spermidine synthase